MRRELLRCSNSFFVFVKICVGESTSPTEIKWHLKSKNTDLPVPYLSITVKWRLFFLSWFF